MYTEFRRVVCVNCLLIVSSFWEDSLRLFPPLTLSFPSSTLKVLQIFKQCSSLLEVAAFPLAQLAITWQWERKSADVTILNLNKTKTFLYSWMWVDTDRIHQRRGMFKGVFTSSKARFTWKVSVCVQVNSEWSQHSAEILVLVLVLCLLSVTLCNSSSQQNRTEPGGQLRITAAVRLINRREEKSPF